MVSVSVLGGMRFVSVLGGMVSVSVIEIIEAVS